MAIDVGTLTEIVVGDDPQAWRAVGFGVDDDGVTRVGTTRIRLVGASDVRGRGILGWALAGVRVLDSGPDSGLDGLDGGLDGLPTIAALPFEDAGGDAAAGPPEHPNGAVHIDHVVAFTPDLDRTTAAIEAAGVAARRTREAGRGRLQRFFRLGEVILELVGPVEPSGDGPAAFWGLAFTVADIDATAAELGDRIGAPKTAVQAGRRIATLRRDDSVSVPIAFMSSAPRRAAEGGSTRPTAAGDDAGRSDDTSL